MSLRRRALFLAGLFVAVSCSDAGNPLESGPRPKPEPQDALQALECSVRVTGADFSCAPAQPGAGGALGYGGTYVGRQDVYVRLERVAAQNIGLDTLQISVTIKNLIPQALGTEDGLTAADSGIRVFFLEDPVTNPGGLLADVTNEDGISSFTNFDQPYFQYDTILKPNEVSAPRDWKLKFDPSVGPTGTIYFRVLLRTQVKYEAGWVDVTPDTDTIMPDSQVQLTAITRNKLGDTTGVSQNVTWSSSDTTIARVDPNGLVTGDSVGSVYIKAMSNGAQVPDSALIVVNSPVQAVDDAVDAVGNVPISYPQSLGVLENDTDADGDAQDLEVTTTTVTTANGTAQFNSDGSFTYLSRSGFSGVDVINYTVTDGVDEDVGTLTVTVGQRYWYVQPTADSTGDGRKDTPFNSLRLADSASAGTEPILVLGGDGEPVDSSGIVLNTGQHLIGQGISSNYTTTLMSGALTVTLLQGTGSSPKIIAKSGTTVMLGENNTLRGVHIASAAGAAVASASLPTGFGTLTMLDQVLLDATGGPALQLNTGNLTGELNSARVFSLSSSGSPTTGLSLTNVTGSLTADGGSISGSTGRAIEVSGQTVSLTYGGSVTKSGADELLRVSNNHHTGTLTFNGSLTATGGSGLVFNDADGNYNFNGITSLSGGPGVSISNNSIGNFFFGTDAEITNATGTGVAVTGNGSGDGPSVIYRGDITQNVNDQLLVTVMSQAATDSAIFEMGTLTAGNGDGILLSDADGIVRFKGAATLNGKAGVGVISGSAGTINVNAATINNTSGIGLEVFESTPTLSFAGSITSSATGSPVVVDGASSCGTISVTAAIVSTGQGIVVQDCSEGTVSLTGTKQLTTGANAAVTLNNNATAAAINLTGGALAIKTTSGTGISSTSGFGTLTVTNATDTTTNGSALSLNNGMLNATFSSLVSSGGGVSLTDVDGTLNVSGGSIAGSVTTPAVRVDDGTVQGTIAAALSQDAPFSTLVITGGHETGTLTFSGSVSASHGDGLQFSDADGTYTFTGVLNLNNAQLTANAGIDMEAASTGTVNVTPAGLNTATITSPTGIAIRVAGGNLTYNGSVTQANNAALLNVAGGVGGHSGTVTFSNGTLSASNGTGLQFENADGTYTFNGTVTLAGGDAGIDLISDSDGTVNVTPSGGHTARITHPSGIAIRITDGSADLDFRGNVNQGNNAALLSVSGGAPGHNGTVSFPGGTSLRAGNGTGLQFDNADGIYDFDGAVVLRDSVAGSDAGIDITNGSAGTFTFTKDAMITNPAVGNLITILQSAPSFTYTGGFQKANNNVSGILVQSNTGGTITFDGDGTSAAGDGDPADVVKSISSGNAAAVNLSSNTGAVIEFSGGGLNLTSGGGAGFTATGGGTVTVEGAENVILSGTGTALNVQNTTIGADELRFRSISHSGGSNGIFLSNTGNGGVQVTGNGTNGSGGSIVNTTGGDGATSGVGVYLNGTRNVRLSWMALSGHANHGIYGTGVRGLTLDHVRLTGTNGTSNSGTFSESALRMDNVGGPVKVTNSRFDGGAFNAVRIDNSMGTAPALDSLVFANDTIETMQGSNADVRSTALLVSLTDGTVDARIRNNRITAWWGNAIHVLVVGTASGSTRIASNFVDNTNGALAGAGGIWIAGCNLAFNISGNTVRNTNGTAIAADKANCAGTTFQGTIDGNAIGVSGVANSGSGTGIGIFAAGRNGTTTVKISNNVLRQINGSANGAITVVAGDNVAASPSGTIHATISGNNIQESGTTVNNAQHGILVTHGTTSSGAGDSHQGCYDVLNNTIINFVSGTANNRIRVNQRFSTTSRWPGYTGAATGATSQTDMATYLLSRNTASTSTNANTSTGGFLNTVPAGSACPQPSM